MTEREIEEHAERRFNELDKAFLAGDLTQKEYDAAFNRIARWAEPQPREKERK